MKKQTLALCTIVLWKVNQQWWLHRILISWYSWYMYLHLAFLIMTGFYKPRKTSLWMYLRFMITLVMKLQSRCQQCSSSPAVIQWVTSTVSPSTCLEARSLSSWASIKFGRAYPSLGDVRRKAKEICPDNYLWFVCSNVCSNLLPVIIQKK